MEHEIQKVVAYVLGVDVGKVNKHSSPETIEEWDSLKQMNIIIALEEEFDIEFDDEEIVDMLNIELINHIVRAKV